MTAPQVNTAPRGRKTVGKQPLAPQVNVLYLGWNNAGTSAGATGGMKMIDYFLILRFTIYKLYFLSRNKCFIAAVGWYRIIRGPAKRITRRIFSRISGL